MKLADRNQAEITPASEAALAYQEAGTLYEEKTE
jgi:hypothetical protein